MAKNPNCLFVLGLAAALCISLFPCASHAQFTFVTNTNNTITITGYTGTGGDVTIPDSTNGLPVTAIGTHAFYFFTNVTSVAIGTNTTSIGQYAFYDSSGLVSVSIPASVTNYNFPGFYGCTNLVAVYLQGNAPKDNYGFGGGIFHDDLELTLYYLPGTTGWNPAFDGRPTALWLPQAQPANTGFDAQTNQFGFNINWASGKTVVVEACSNLINPVWTPIATNTVTGGSSWFSDPQWTNSPGRYYRLLSP